MDFQFTEEQEIFRKTVIDFVEKEVAPLADEVDRSDETPMHLFKRMGELGFLGLTIPEEYGGSGADMIIFCIFLEEMFRVSGSVAFSMMLHSISGLPPICRFGTDEQRRKYLLPGVKGEMISAFALTEPNAGSDVAAIQTTARRSKDHYILNGTKTFITNSTIADFFIVCAVLDKTKGIKGIALFIVEKGFPGFSVGRKLDKLGFHGSATGEIIFDDCRIPIESLLGEEEGGFISMLKTLQFERIAGGAMAIGSARAAFDDAMKHAKERVQFGQLIGKFQAIQFMLADVATEIELAKLLVYKAAWMESQGMRCSKESSMAKVYASEVAFRSADVALQIYGGYGYTMDYPVQRYLRDARVLRIAGGTSEIQRVVIADELGL